MLIHLIHSGEQQRELEEKAFNQLRLEHIDGVKFKKDVFYLIFWPSYYYDSDNIDKENVIYKAALDFYRYKSVPLIKKEEWEYKSRGDEILGLVRDNNWNKITSDSSLWSFLETICPDSLRSRLELLKR